MLLFAVNDFLAKSSDNAKFDTKTTEAYRQIQIKTSILLISHYRNT